MENTKWLETAVVLDFKGGCYTRPEFWIRIGALMVFLFLVGFVGTLIGFRDTTLDGIAMILGALHVGTTFAGRARDIGWTPYLGWFAIIPGGILVGLILGCWPSKTPEVLEIS